MSCVESKLEDALVLFLKDELNRTDIFPSLGDDIIQLPVLVVCCNDSSEKTYGDDAGLYLPSGNFEVSGFVEVMTQYKDMTRAEHYTLFNSFRNALHCESLKDVLMDQGIANFHIYSIRTTRTQHTVVEENKRVSRLYFEAVCMSKDLE